MICWSPKKRFIQKPKKCNMFKNSIFFSSNFNQNLLVRNVNRVTLLLLESADHRSQLKNELFRDHQQTRTHSIDTTLQFWSSSKLCLVTHTTLLYCTKLGTNLWRGNIFFFSYVREGIKKSFVYTQSIYDGTPPPT